jgi:hypothetical protein
LKAYLRLLFAFVALGLLAVSVVGVLYVWENLIAPEKAITAEIEEIRKRPKVKIDHGEKVYQEAVRLLAMGAQPEGVKQLHELMVLYRESSRYEEAKRIVGEINVDRLLSKEPAPGKAEYIVKSGDALTRIANKAKSTIGYIMHVNGRMGSGLQKGDQLIVCPLEFSIVVKLSDKTVTLRSAEGKFFKDYPLLSYRIPSSTPSSFDTEISALVVSTGARLVPVGTRQYVAAAKELRSNRRGAPLRSLSGDAEKDKYVTGFILAREDIEELALIIRPGTKLHIRK